MTQAARARRAAVGLADVIDDPCPYVDERSNDLTLAPRSRIDVCRSGIEEWYPVRVGCVA